MRYGTLQRKGSLACSLVATLLALPPAVRGQAAVSGAAEEEIIVTSSIVEMPRRRIGTSVSVLEGEEMQLRGYNALADALRTQPGVGVSNSGGPGKSTTLRIRGEENFRTVLMIDGVKAVDPSAPQVSPGFDSLLMTNDLERVEVLRGPQGFIYGADAGGVVNVLSRRGAGDLGGRLGVELGEFSTRKLDASAAGGSGRGDFFVSATDLETDGFNAQTADTVLRDDDGADNITLHTKLGWNATDALRLQLVARDIDAAAQYDGCFSSVTFETVHDCTTATEQTTYKVSADYSGGKLRSRFGYSRADIDRNDVAEGSAAFATQGELSRVEYTGSFDATAAASVVFGFDLQNERTTSVERLERDQHGLYAEYQGSFDGRFYIAAGARYDDNEAFGSYTSTRLSGAYVQDLRGGDTLKYRFSFGTGFRAPSLYEIAYNAGPFAAPPAATTTLREERSRGYDAGIEYGSAGGLRIDFTLFDQLIEDEIFFDLADFSGYLQSPGESTSKGLELAVEVPLGEQWRLLGNWTRNDTQNTANEQRLRRPKSFGNIGVLYAASSERLRLALNYRFAYDSIDVGGIALDDYSVLDLSLSYSFAEAFEVYARIENAADERYQEVIGHNTARRAAYGGVRFVF